MAISTVTRELLVRYLDTWAPAALHSGRRATFAMGWSDAADLEVAESALRVFGEFADRLRGRRLAIVAVAPEPAGLVQRLDAVQAELGTPAGLSVHTVAGDGVALLPAALTAAGAAGAALLAYLDLGAGNADDAFRAVAGGRPAELFTVSAQRPWAEHRGALRAAGFPLTAGVELVGHDGSARLVAFATSSAKNLEAFKNALWAADEFAGVRYRDPQDPDGHLLDISLNPHPGPLRRELLSHLDAGGERTVTDLRRFTLTETVYRAADTTQALTSLLAAGAVVRRPPGGRLAGDVIIAPVKR
jgi:hypothetical protein